ncbi:unnamed protein product [Coffea canephora]|uniref:DUF668 domain-containing protein n=1 Tax=Coffea canephora TaxID=49390 RepID=A0A068UDD8_COFCA|nr:unnamed protein product [Coffea canephora]
MGWLLELSARKHGDDVQKSNQLGILAFETAKTMSKLVSLYKSLSHDQISRLAREVVTSQGIAYLNSMDEGLLFGLACAERLEDLDKTATAVAQLGQKCRDFGLKRFDLVYNELKLGIVDLWKLGHGSKHVEKKVQKMEKLIAATASLYSSLDALAELEISERKLGQWKHKGPSMQGKPNFQLFKEKLEKQRKQVHHLREVSLWSQTFDKSVHLMARVVCFVYARLYVVFGPYVPVLSSVSLGNLRPSHQKEILKDSPAQCCIIAQLMNEQIHSHSGPIPTASNSKLRMVRFYSRKSVFFLDEDDDLGDRKVSRSNRVFHAAGPSTVGGSGLALRYANVILLAEKCLDSAESLDPETRESLYQMLPENVKSLVKSKLSKNVKGTEDDQLLAVGWREALRGIMGWLAPMAHDTVQWHLERNPEKMKFDLKPTVLLLQTLHFSDKEKTEAAIAEVLVSLSCIFKHENCILSCESS